MYVHIYVYVLFVVYRLFSMFKCLFIDVLFVVFTVV